MIRQTMSQSQMRLITRIVAGIAAVAGDTLLVLNGWPPLVWCIAALTTVPVLTLTRRG